MDKWPAGAEVVSRGSSEARLDWLARQSGDPQAGFFGPASMSWKVNRESAVFLGAGRAALLQLAHPWVAAALAQHSTLLHQPVGRFHSTFRVIYTMLFGTRAQALEAARQLYRRHTSIRGQLSTGEHYEANQVQALVWVYATLVDSALLAYEFALPGLLPAEREQYYAESHRMAALFGIPAEALPANWIAFTAYMDSMLASSQLSVDGEALALGQSVLSGVGTALHPPHWYRALTSFWLPSRLQDAFALPFGPAEQRAVQRARRWLPPLYRSLPRSLRLVGPLHEAEARLRGHSPGPLTRRSNQFWMGEPRLLYSPLAE
jgi:uncharacterized protein (DUF2236 family)